MSNAQEADLQSVLNSGITAQQAVYLSEVTTAAHAIDHYGDLFALMVGFFEQIGAGAVSCAIFDNQDFALIGFSTSLRQRVLDDVAAIGLQLEDPLLGWMKRSTEPAVLGFGFGVTPPWSAGRMPLFLEYLHNAGYYGLLFQPVRLAGGPFSTAITIATELEPASARQYLSTHSTLMLVAATLLAQRAAKLFTLSDTDDSWRLRRSRPLSVRETQVVSALSRGDRSEQIAHDLKIKPVTVHMHVASARQKLGARTRAQLVSLALQMGLV